MQALRAAQQQQQQQEQSSQHPQQPQLELALPEGPLSILHLNWRESVRKGSEHAFLADIPLDRLQDFLEGERQRGDCSFTLVGTEKHNKPTRPRQDSVKWKETYVCCFGKKKTGSKLLQGMRCIECQSSQCLVPGPLVSTSFTTLCQQRMQGGGPIVLDLLSPINPTLPCPSCMLVTAATTESQSTPLFSGPHCLWFDLPFTDIVCVYRVTKMQYIAVICCCVAGLRQPRLSHKCGCLYRFDARVYWRSTQCRSLCTRQTTSSHPVMMSPAMGVTATLRTRSSCMMLACLLISGPTCCSSCWSIRQHAHNKLSTVSSSCGSVRHTPRL